MNALGYALAASGMALMVGCGSSNQSSQSPGMGDGGSEGSTYRLLDASVADAAGADAGEDAPETFTGRTLTTRALLPTPVNNLLIDPFITSDTAWGHFRAIVPAVDPAETGGDCPHITRELLSASPIGISAPVVLVSPAVLPASMGCTAIVAPFVGSTEPVSAQMWVSLSDGSGTPLPFPSATDAGAATASSFLTVALLSDALPSSTSPSTSYPLTIASAAPTVLGGRQWGLLELASPVSIPEGGWFAITLTNPTGSLYLAAPQVVPATATAQAVSRPLGMVLSRPMAEVERGAVLQYGRLLHVRPQPQGRVRPRSPDGT